jgi:hypothetical protein
LNSESLVRVLCRAEDVTKRWEPLTTRHADVFNELKDIIKTYVEERCGEKTGSDCIVPVLYGVFGSGKTTLSVELCKWALNEGIPAIRAYLADVIKYIREELHRSEVDESDLPSYIESFFEEYLRRNGYGGEIKRGVLFIDEIEEGYEELKKLVKGMSLLRGTVDKARTGASKVLPVLLFAPSSALAEALRYATVWRVKVYAIPPLPPETIKREYLDKLSIRLHEKLRDSDKLIKALLANTLWWLSKGGRPGLIEKILNEGIIDAIINNINYVASSGRFEDIKYCFEPVNNYEMADKIRKVLGFEVVEGIPFARYSDYDNLIIVAENYDKRFTNLAKLLVCIGSPLPESIAKVLGVDVKGLSIPRELGIAASNKVLDKDKIIARYLTYASLIESNIDESLRKDLRQALDEVLSAWSLNNKVLYDKESLEQLLGEILQLKALENANEKLLNIILRFDIERFLNDLSEDVREDPTYYYTLRINVLRSLYPPTLVQPVIGCAKGEDITTMASVADTNVPDSLMQFSSKLKTVQDFINEVKSSKNIVIVVYPIFGEQSLRYVNAQLNQHVRNNELVLLLNFASIPILRKYAKYPSIERTRETLIKYFGECILKLLDKAILIEEIPSALAQYLLSLSYSMIKCPDKLTKLDALDRIVQIQSSRQFKEFLEGIIKKYEIFHTKIVQQLTELGKIVEGLEVLTENAEREVGSAHGRYIWTAVVSDKATNLLIRFVNALKNLNELDELGMEQYRIIKERLTTGISLLIINGERYINRSQQEYRKLETALRDENFKELTEFLDGIVCTYVNDVTTYGVRRTIDNLSRDVWKEHIKYDFPEAGRKILMGILLRNHMNRRSVAPSIDVTDTIKHLINVIKQIRDVIDKIDNDQKKLLNTSSAIDVRINLPNLSKYKSSIDKFIDDLNSIVKELDEMPDVYGKTILSEYIYHIIYGGEGGRRKENLIDRLKEYQNVLSNIRSSLMKLNFITEDITTLKKKLGEMKIEQTTKIIEIIDRDLRKIFNVLSEKMYKEGISRDLLENAVKKLSEYNEKVKQLEKEIKSADSEVMKIYGYVNEIKKLLS